MKDKRTVVVCWIILLLFIQDIYEQFEWQFHNIHYFIRC